MTAGLLLGNLRELFDENVLPAEEPFHAEGIAEGQIALDDHPIKTGQNSRDFILVLCYKRVHGVFLPERLVVQPFWEEKTPFPLLFGCGEAALGEAADYLLPLA